MGAHHQTLREVYAQYFFSVIDASLHQDEASRRLAQQHLEDSLVFADSAPQADAKPGYTW